MAEVHLAMQRGPAGFEKLVVVKLVHAHLATQREFVDMLLDEARVAAMVKHPNVVDIYDLGEAAGRYFIAMEYLEGEPLLAVLRAGTEGRPLDPLSTARVIADTAEGLDAAHRLKGRDGKPLGLVHHDVTLGNIVVLYTGQVKLVDFGVAKAATAVTRDRVQGKFGYMAPEKLEQTGVIDRRSDVWSLGCVAWEALTLSRLFKGDTDEETAKAVLEMPVVPPSKVNGSLPADFDRIVMTALERDPEKRYPTAKAMAHDLEEILRKRGYSGKNDKIAKHMEVAFAAHIAARERLLHDAREGRPSEQVIEAAFHEPATVSEFTVTTSGPAARASTAVSMSSALATMEETSDRPSRNRIDPSWASLPRGREIGELQQQLDARRRRERDRRRRIRGGLAFGGVLAVVLVIALATKGDEPKVTVTVPPPAIAQVTPPAPVAAPVERTVAPEPEIIIDPINDPVGDPPDEPPEEPSEPIQEKQKRRVKRSPGNAEKLYATGLDQLRRGEPRAALVSLTGARRANPRFAPTWYGLGLVHEKLGNKPSAKVAYERYLELAPNAANAAQIKSRIAQLK
jgi:serine/threonine protein kinase